MLEILVDSGEKVKSIAHEIDLLTLLTEKWDEETHQTRHLLIHTARLVILPTNSLRPTAFLAP